MTTPQKHRVLDILAPFLLGVTSIASFWKIALTNRILAGLDVFAYFYPYREYTSQVLRQGKIPLWNPYLFMGAPLLANSQTAALYPLHLPLLWLSTPKHIAWSIVIHIWLAGTGTYVFCRMGLGLRPRSALLSGLIFSLGGFLGAQVEHINQLNTSAWLPWLLICLYGATRQSHRRWLALLAGGMVVGLVLLAGHTQAAYIVLFGGALYALQQSWVQWRRTGKVLSWHGLPSLAVMVGFGVLLAAGQLLPTLELSAHSIRSGGLPYREAISFSLSPGLIPRALLPPYFWDPPFSEYVAHVGIAALALATLGACRSLKKKDTSSGAILMSLAGIFLALGLYNPAYYLFYTFIPGFDLFRAPARWLLLYAFGVSLLSGIGSDETIHSNRPWVRHATKVALLIVVAELFLARRPLAYNNPTTPIAYDSMRTAPAVLLADSDPAPFRFLSISDTRYDPGDMVDLTSMYNNLLTDNQIYDLLVTTKIKEVLAYNLPLRYQVHSVDGYDGGLLPTKSYVTLQRLFLSPENISTDGRFRQQLTNIPDTRLLSLLNVKYVITDKTRDSWIQDVFYDLQHTLELDQVTLTDLPDFVTTHIGIVYQIDEDTAPDSSSLLAELVVSDEEGSTAPLAIRMPSTLERDNLSVLTLPRSMKPDSIWIESNLPSQTIQIRGLSLVNLPAGTSRSVSVDPSYRQIHSGDVKVYENLEMQPRAFVVHETMIISDSERALATLKRNDFDPTRQVVLADGKRLSSPTRTQQSIARILQYEPEEILIEAELDSPGYLVLTDSFYPGWEADIDGNSEGIVRANLHFRAVLLTPGKHEIIFRYRPKPVYIGFAISFVTLSIWLALLATTMGRIGRSSSTIV